MCVSFWLFGSWFRYLVESGAGTLITGLHVMIMYIGQANKLVFEFFIVLSSRGVFSFFYASPKILVKVSRAEPNYEELNFFNPFRLFKAINLKKRKNGKFIQIFSYHLRQLWNYSIVQLIRFFDDILCLFLIFI